MEAIIWFRCEKAGHYYGQLKPTWSQKWVPKQHATPQEILEGCVKEKVVTPKVVGEHAASDKVLITPDVGVGDVLDSEIEGG